MTDTPTADTSEPRRPLRISRAWRVLRFPLTRIVTATVAVTAAGICVQVALHLLLDPLGLRDVPAVRLVIACATAATACLTYAGFVRLLEWRPAVELGAARAARECAAGAAIGCGLMSAVIATMFAAGAYEVEGMNSPDVLIRWVGIGIGTGIFEEIVFRCVLFRIAEECLGSLTAVLISAAFFGFAHLGNPGATVWSSVAISLEAGLLLSAAFMLTRRLWMAASLHGAWNFTQGGLFGAAVSGGEAGGWLKATLSGPDWLTGGKFGPEASVPAVVLCTAAGVALLVLAALRGSWLSYSLARSRRATPQPVEPPTLPATDERIQVADNLLQPPPPAEPLPEAAPGNISTAMTGEPGAV